LRRVALAAVIAVPDGRLEEAGMDTRSPEEVFAHHAQALGAEDLDGIIADYTDDAVIITPTRVLWGKEGVRENFVQLLGDVPQAAWDIKNTA
jgi:ketosteroid isomerase-like protein